MSRKNFMTYEVIPESKDFHVLSKNEGKLKLWTVKTISKDMALEMVASRYRLNTVRATINGNEMLIGRQLHLVCVKNDVKSVQNALNLLGWDGIDLTEFTMLTGTKKYIDMGKLEDALAAV